jgi:hypothetical protein
MVVATAAFVQVVLVNICYDVPVKLLSLHLLLQCIFLLVAERERFFAFFLNKAATPSNTYNVLFNAGWLRIGRLFLKASFFFLFVAVVSYNQVERNKKESRENDPKKVAILPGRYNVQKYLVNNQPLIAPADSLRRSIVFRPNGTANFNIVDSLFFNLDSRGYFFYTPDTASRSIHFKLAPTRSEDAFVFNYQLTGNNMLVLDGWVRKDSVHIEMLRDVNQFPLANRPFHWMSETVP